jgi:hypothetical protein
MTEALLYAHKEHMLDDSPLSLLLFFFFWVILSDDDSSCETQIPAEFSTRLAVPATPSHIGLTELLPLLLLPERGGGDQVAYFHTSV